MATEPVWSSEADVRPSAWSAVAWFAATVAGSAVLGLLGGWIWGEAAPRATLEEISAGTAQLMNAETRAFFGADVWFCAIAAVAGLLTGIIGFRFCMAGRTSTTRPVIAAGLILGGVAGAFAMLWLGQQIGLSAYNQHLASSADGTVFPESLNLGARSALAFWPMFTAIVILIGEWGTRASR